MFIFRRATWRFHCMASTTLVMSVGPCVLLAQQPNPADSAYDPGIIVKHSNFFNGITLVLKCDTNDPQSSLAGCRDAIGTRRMELERLKLQTRHGTSVQDYDAKRLRVEQQIADYVKTFAYISAHPSSFSPTPPKKRFSYLYSPTSPSSAQAGGNNANYAGDESAVTVLNSPKVCSFSEVVTGIMGTLTVPDIKPAVGCTGSNSYTFTTSWWIGLGGDSTVTGYNGHVDQILYQVGVIGQVECVLTSNGTSKGSEQRQYIAFQQYTPGEDATAIASLAKKISPGDSVTLSLTVADDGGMTYTILDNGVGDVSVEVNKNPSQVPQNTAEFMSERNIVGGYSYPIPVPNPKNQSSAFAGEMAMGTAYLSTGLGPEIVYNSTYPLNTSQTNTNGCLTGQAFCAASFTDNLTPDTCDTETGVGSGSTGGYNFTENGLPGSGGC